MSPPLPSFNTDLVPYLLVALFMVAGNLYLLSRLFPRTGGTPNLATVVLVVGLLVMTLGLWFAVVYAIVSPGDASTVSVFIAGNSMMAVFGAWLVGVFYRGEEKRLQPSRLVWPLVIATLLVANEFLMGCAFVLAQFGPSQFENTGWVGLSQLLNDAATSIWFFWAMLATMLLLTLWLPLNRAERSALLGLASSAAVGPWVIASPLVGGAAMAGVMTATFVVLLEELGRPSAVSPRFLRLALAVGGGFAAMTVGEFLFLTSSDSATAPIPFVVGSVLVMGAELFVLTRWAFGGAEPDRTQPVPLYQRPAATAGFLALGFATEWVMAAGLLVAINGPSVFPSGISSAPNLLAVIGSTFAHAIETVARVTASPIFLGLMGIEMGALVVTRMRRATERAQRARLGLALGSYGVYTVLAPALLGTWALIPGAWPNIGAFGPVTLVAVPVIVGSYGVFVALVALFGRRAFCSVMCPSAVMYGGTVSQRLIPTLRESPIARHQVLGRRWRPLAIAIAISSWISFGAVAAVSVWDTTFGGRGILGGFDPSVLYAAAIWNVVWYGFFISIPYVGMSPSRNWGFCSTGTLLGVVGYFGFYRKEALDIEVCRRCTTHDCGKSCEVGLVDMPVVLARTGTYRSMKCVGAHDCEVACPYGNLVSRDIRDSIRKWIGLPDRFASRAPLRVPVSIPTASIGTSLGAGSDR